MRKEILAENAPFLTKPVIQKGFEIAAMAGGEGRLVGGVVRDHLLGRALGDFDMAVTVPIADFANSAQAAGYQIIETGLAHGSVTLYHDGEALEVTQTRADIKTDGRHATIGFTPSFDEDARRRDFTINALYLAADGTLYDPLGARGDLAARHLRFIGAAEARIREDYLRILRFFRFASQLDGFTADAQDLSAVSAHFGGLSQLSGERVLYELRKIFGGANWPDVMQMMRQTGLDEALCGDKFSPLLARYQKLENWQAAAASCLTQSTAEVFLKLPHSRKDRAMIKGFLTPLTKADFEALQSDHWREVVHFGGNDFSQRCLIQARHHRGEISEARLEEITNFTPPPCPVTGHDLQQAGVAPGPELGKLLHEAERLYVRSDYQLDKAQIIAKLPV